MTATWQPKGKTYRLLCVPPQCGRCGSMEQTDAPDIAFRQNQDGIYHVCWYCGDQTRVGPIH